MKSTDLRT